MRVSTHRWLFPIAAIEALFVVVYRSQADSLLWIFMYSLAINTWCFVLYKILIYPNFISPLRHLPSPQVGGIRRISLHT